jgi:hypothetical protein
MPIPALKLLVNTAHRIAWPLLKRVYRWIIRDSKRRDETRADHPCAARRDAELRIQNDYFEKKAVLACSKGSAEFGQLATLTAGFGVNAAEISFDWSRGVFPMNDGRRFGFASNVTLLTMYPPRFLVGFESRITMTIPEWSKWRTA